MLFGVLMSCSTNYTVMEIFFRGNCFPGCTDRSQRKLHLTSTLRTRLHSKQERKTSPERTNERKMKNIRVFVVCLLLLVVSASFTAALPSKIRVASLQIFPAADIAGTADAVLALIAKTQAAKGRLDLVNLPEFLFTPGINYDAAGDCSGDGTNSSGRLAQLCYPVPPAGSSLNCADGLPLESPARRIGCSILSNESSQTAVSINVCEFVERNGTLYNTNVVVRGGQVIARYRKKNVFFTKCYSTPDLELVTFNVSGRKFGIFTCFDILFYSPKMNLVKAGIKYFSYSVSMPLLARDAVSLFSWQNHVTVVNSNAAAGQSSVVVDGTNIARCEGSDPCAAVAELE